MIDALISGKLIKTPELKTGQSGKFYSRLLLSEEICEDNCRSKATVPTKVIRTRFKAFEIQFKQMIECRDWMKSGTPLPALPHSTEQ
jgi:hypothetical protein